MSSQDVIARDAPVVPADARYSLFAYTSLRVSRTFRSAADAFEDSSARRRPPVAHLTHGHHRTRSPMIRAKGRRTVPSDGRRLPRTLHGVNEPASGDPSRAHERLRLDRFDACDVPTSGAPSRFSHCRKASRTMCRAVWYQVYIEVHAVAPSDRPASSTGASCPHRRDSDSDPAARLGCPAAVSRPSWMTRVWFQQP